MRGMNPAALQSMFQAVHSGKGGIGYDQAGKLKKKQPMMLHSDPSILGTLAMLLLSFYSPALLSIHSEWWWLSSVERAKRKLINEGGGGL